MILRTRLSRSEGYRLLGMYDESILILEDIPPGKERWDSLVVEAVTTPIEMQSLGACKCNVRADVWERPNSLKWRSIMWMKCLSLVKLMTRLKPWRK